MLRFHCLPLEVDGGGQSTKPEVIALGMTKPSEEISTGPLLVQNRPLRHNGNVVGALQVHEGFVAERGGKWSPNQRNMVLDTVRDEEGTTADRLVVENPSWVISVGGEMFTGELLATTVDFGSPASRCYHPELRRALCISILHHVSFQHREY